MSDFTKPGSDGGTAPSGVDVDVKRFKPLPQPLVCMTLYLITVRVEVNDYYGLLKPFFDWINQLWGTTSKPYDFRELYFTADLISIKWMDFVNCPGGNCTEKVFKLVSRATGHTWRKSYAFVTRAVYCKPGAGPGLPVKSVEDPEQDVLKNGGKILEDLPPQAAQEERLTFVFPADRVSTRTIPCPGSLSFHIQYREKSAALPTDFEPFVDNSRFSLNQHFADYDCAPPCAKKLTINRKEWIYDAAKKEVVVNTWATLSC